MKIKFLEISEFQRADRLKKITLLIRLGFYMAEKDTKRLTINAEDLEKFKLKFSLGQDEGRGSRHFLRIKITEGALTSDQLKEIAKLSEKHSKGRAWVTDRQSIQLHWIEGQNAPQIFAKLEKIGFTTDKCGQAYPKPGYGDLRNVCTCPIAGFEKHEKINVKPIAEEINEFFIGNPEFLDMPKKFKISISACDIDCSRSQMQDLGFFHIEKDGEDGFRAVIGGSMGIAEPGAVIGKPLNVFIRPDEVFEVSKNMAEIHRDNSNTEDVSKARFKWLIDQWGVEKVRNRLEKKLGRKLERFEYSGPETSGREHVGVQEQKNGKYFINIPLIGGRITAKKLKKIARISEEYGSGDIRTTPYQNLIILNIPPENKNDVLEDLKNSGLPVKGSRVRWEGVACSASYCANSPSYHPKDVLEKIINNLEEKYGPKLDDFRLKIGISGCARDCGLLKTSDIGMLGCQPGDCIEEEKYFPHLNGNFGEDAKFSENIGERKEVSKLNDFIESIVGTALDEGYSDMKKFLDKSDLEELKKEI